MEPQLEPLQNEAVAHAHEPPAMQAVDAPTSPAGPGLPPVDATTPTPRPQSESRIIQAMGVPGA
jgi:hypothetical protein